MFRVLFLLLLGLVLVGCADSPKLVSVDGKVSHKGKPICPGSIYFEPVEGGQTLTASSLLGMDGSFHLRTYHNQRINQGVMPGTYKVTLNLGGGTTAELAKYTQAKTSTVQIEVPQEGKKDLLIDLQ